MYNKNNTYGKRGMYAFMESGNVDRALLKHYCHTVWEYDAALQKVYIHYDAIFPDMENAWHDMGSLFEFYSDGCLFGADIETWRKNLGKDALNEFLRSDEECRRFELRFTLKNRVPEWYEIYIEKSGAQKVIISGRNIYGNVIGESIRKTARNLLGNIFYIDVLSGCFISHYSCTEIKGISDGAARYDETVRKYFSEYVIDDNKNEILESMRLSNVKRALSENESFTVYATMIGENGALSKKFVYFYLDPAKTIIVFAEIDVSDIVDEYESRIRRFRKESYRDFLTGAYNRNYFEENLKSAVISSGVAILDLDDFKLCNDVFGHSAGDEALITAVQTVRRCMNPTDCLIRYGGDEFLLILQNLEDEQMLEKRLTDIQNKVHSAVVAGNPNVKLSVSIGGVLCKKDETIEEAVSRADKLMYQAKGLKNMVVTESKAIRDGKREHIVMKNDYVKQQILVVDDLELNREILSDMLRDNFKILTASNGAECIEMLRQYGTGISLVLLDIIMPVMDGFEVLSYMNKTNMIEDIPVIMISGEKSDDAIRRAFSLGVSDYVSSPFDSKVVFRRVLNIINLHVKQRRLISLVAKQAAEKEKNSRIMVDILGQVVEFRNGESGMHVKDINKFTGLLLEELVKKTDKYELSREDCSLIATASALHDIGKICIDEKILNKPGKLTKEEFEIIKTHTTLGAEMISSLDEFKNEKLVKVAYEICRWHHERYDGKGYPDGLKGEEIPISAQVVSIADVYDALTSERVYKPAFSHEKSMKMITDGKCGVFNPLLVECLCDIQDKIRKDKNRDLH